VVPIFNFDKKLIFTKTLPKLDVMTGKTQDTRHQTSGIRQEVSDRKHFAGCIRQQASESRQQTLTHYRPSNFFVSDFDKF